MRRKLRDYQKTARNQIWHAIAVEKSKAVIAAMPTGVGKGTQNADLAGGIYTAYPSQRILCVTHSKILVSQNAQDFREMWPNLPMGIISAGLKLREYGMPIAFAGIGSIYKKPELLGKVNILIIDEAHAVSDKDTSMYVQLINYLRSVNPNLVVIGLTATPYRMGMGLLTEGEIFTNICIDMCSPEWIEWFVQEGYLLPLIAKRTSTFIDTSDVKLTGGDYNLKGLSNAAMRGDMTERAIAEALPVMADRKSIAIYCVSIEHVEQVVLALDAYGLECEYVHSKAGDDHNVAALERFNSGQTRFIASMGQLTTGWNCPRLDCIIMLRPTRSPGLWVQMLGRGTRPMYCRDAYEGADGVWRVPDLETKEGRLAAIARSQKHGCLVLDFARNTEDIGPFDDPRLPKRRGKGGGQAIMKACQKGRMIDPEYIGCGSYAWPAERYCKDCGVEYYFEVKFDSTTSGKAIMGNKRDPKPFVEPEIADFNVSRVTYMRHSKMGKPDSVKVSYFCGIRQFNMFLCPDHGGGATARARQWWRKHIDSSPPNGVDNWMERMDEAAIPKSIKVKLKKDWPDIMDWSFE